MQNPLTLIEKVANPMPAERPLRSILFMPGNNLRAMEKARGLDCDAVVLDLEDAVAEPLKEEARACVKNVLLNKDFGDVPVIVRINNIRSEWGFDDIMALEGTPFAILAPKVDSRQDVLDTFATMKLANMPASVALWAMIETPQAIAKLDEIAGCAALSCLMFGANDFSRDVNAAQTIDRRAIISAVQSVVTAARAHGKIAIDSVYNDVLDAEGLMIQAKQGKEFGFDGKSLIHPNQVEIVNEIFAPNSEEVEHANAVIRAFESARKAGKSVAKFDNKMIEQLHVDAAKDLLHFYAMCNKD